MHAARMIATTVVIGLAALALSQDASAQRRGRDTGGETVTAQSWYGGATITAPVRNGPNGRELRLPGGTWISCEQQCANTLREQTIDFWGTLERRGGGANRP